MKNTKTEKAVTVKSLSVTTKLPVGDIEKAVTFVTVTRKESALKIMVDWLHVGMVLDRIKSNVEKKEFKPAIDSVFGTEFNNNDRAYSMRLAKQERATILEWYVTSGCSVTSPKRVFELFASDEANAGKVVDAPKKKNNGGKDKKESKPVDSLTIMQLATTLVQTVRKADENGDLVLEDYAALEKVLSELTAEMADGVKRETKAKAVNDKKKAA